MKEFSKKDIKEFLSLKKEVDPLIKRLASTISYQKMGFTYLDIVGLYEGKLIDLFLKYKEDEDKLYLIITSLKNYQTKLYKKVPENVIRIDDYDAEFIIPSKDKSLEEQEIIQRFLDFIKPQLAPAEYKLFHLLTWPPLYILNRVNDISKRIPSHLILEFLGESPDKKALKSLNTLRRRLDLKIQSFTQEFHLQVA